MLTSSRALARDLGGRVAMMFAQRAARPPRSLATLGMTRRCVLKLRVARLSRRLLRLDLRDEDRLDVVPAGTKLEGAMGEFVGQREVAALAHRVDSREGHR